jgi:hypothetical protein
MAMVVTFITTTIIVVHTQVIEREKEKEGEGERGGGRRR